MTTQAQAEANARAIQRRGHWRRLTVAIGKFKVWRADPTKGEYRMALDALAALEVEMRRAGQEP